jgi:hypothetical protein
MESPTAAVKFDGENVCSGRRHGRASAEDATIYA